MSSLSKIEKQINELEAAIPKMDVINQDISKRGVDWHLDHSLQVISAIVNALDESKPDNFKSNLTKTGSIILLFGIIPRGKGKSPKQVNNLEVINKDELLENLNNAKASLKLLPTIPEDAYFPHPIFGNIKYKKAIRFIWIHTQHHIKIIRDILKKSPK